MRDVSVEARSQACSKVRLDGSRRVKPLVCVASFSLSVSVPSLLHTHPSPSSPQSSYALADGFFLSIVVLAIRVASFLFFLLPLLLLAVTVCREVGRSVPVVFRLG